jgi:hypothetical protein
MVALVAVVLEQLLQRMELQPAQSSSLRAAAVAAVQAVVAVPPTTLNQLLVKQPSLPMDLPMDQPVLVMGQTDTPAVAAVELTAEKMVVQPLHTLVVQAMTMADMVVEVSAVETQFQVPRQRY